jgi:hypothetical protein
MELLLLAAFLTLLTVLTLAGWVADSRDGADWSPSINGMRAPARH